MAEAPVRQQRTETVVEVRHIAKPLGTKRENGPHLADLRRFVEACEGLPDETLVRIDNGHLSEGGRRDVVLFVRWVQVEGDLVVPEAAEPGGAS